MARNADDECFKILISTDNHLGVWEKDPVRADDSFRSFEEVLDLAHEHKADMVLLGGDLFHDNKPSRTTLVRTMDILSKACLNSNPVRVELMSNPKLTVVGGALNYQSKNHNIGLPVFTIHGNHDDPSVADSLSAVNILSSAKLVNYFGKACYTGEPSSLQSRITLRPLVLRKGNTLLALYGLGNLRDERLGRMFNTPGAVTWVRPEKNADKHINVFVLHQNRTSHAPNAKNFVKESMLPSWMDLVIWGHEHECIPTTSYAPNNTACSILQPGSTVATALSEGESKPKHAFLLKILGVSWKLDIFPLETVRPFIFDSVELAKNTGLDPQAPGAVERYLHSRIEAMLGKASKMQRGAEGHGATQQHGWQGDADGGGGRRGGGGGRKRKQRDGVPEGDEGVKDMLPLIRLRVDYSGCSTINTQRFGHKFVDRVANPHDLFLWHKNTQKRAQQQGQQQGQGADAGDIEEAALKPTMLDAAEIEAMVTPHLPAALEFAPSSVLALALSQFLKQDEKQAFQTCMQEQLTQHQQTQFAAKGVNVDLTRTNPLANNAVLVPTGAAKPPTGRGRGRGAAAAQMVAAAALGAPAASVLDFGGTSQIVTSSGQALRARPQPTSTHATQPPTQATATSGGGRGGRGRGRGGRGAGRAQVVVCDDSDSVEEDEDEDAVVEIRGNPRTTRNRRNNGNDAYMADAIDDDEDAPTPQRPRPRQSTAPRGRRGASPLALTATTPASARPPSIVLDDDEDDEEQASVIAPTPSGNARGSQPASARKRALPGIFGIRGGSSQAGGRTRA